MEKCPRITLKIGQLRYIQTDSIQIFVQFCALILVFQFDILPQPSTMKL
jgi:hypothetical protein